MNATSHFLPQSSFHAPVVSIVASHFFRNLQHSVGQFGIKIFFSYFSNSQLNISSSMPYSNYVNSIRIRHSVPDVSSLFKWPRRYCNCPYPCTAAKCAKPNPLYFVVRKTASLAMFLFIPIFGRIVLNYSHSRNPTRVRAHMHRHARALREPHSSEECLRMHTLSQYRT
jgi:hypothetical protein